MEVFTHHLYYFTFHRYLLGTRYPEINRNITKFIKKMNTFPDYTEIAHIIRETNNKGGRFLSEEGILQLGIYHLKHFSILLVQLNNMLPLISSGSICRSW